MPQDTIISINIGVGTLIVGMVVFFLALLGIIWKGKSEISTSIKDELSPLERNIRNVVNAITEIHTVLKNKFEGLSITHTMVERGDSPLNPTEFGASLIKDSGLEKILDNNKELFCVKLKAALPTNYTEYDVQEYARKLLVDLKDDPIMNPVKQWVYNNPMDIRTILRVGGLWLKNDFLKEPRGINKTEPKS